MADRVCQVCGRAEPHDKRGRPRKACSPECFRELAARNRIAEAASKLSTELDEIAEATAVPFEIVADTPKDVDGVAFIPPKRGPLIPKRAEHIDTAEARADAIDFLHTILTMDGLALSMRYSAANALLRLPVREAQEVNAEEMAVVEEFKRTRFGGLRDASA